MESMVLPFFVFASAAAGSGQAANDEVIDKIRRKGFRILVIDDDDRFRNSFCFKLKRKYAVQVQSVNSGMSAIAAIQDGKSFDLIFTDIMMPGMTGVETYNELIRLNPALKIVVMSAYSDSDEWKKAQELGAILIHKPIPDDVLIRILSEL
jgi:CheY-like chemotaxis protein